MCSGDINDDDSFLIKDDEIYLRKVNGNVFKMDTSAPCELSLGEKVTSDSIENAVAI